MGDLLNGAQAWGLVASACLLDRLVGDPHRWPHPVQVMGAAIGALRSGAERLCRGRPLALRLAGLGITLLVVVLSGLAGWALETLALWRPALGVPLLLIGLASALAGRSLEQAVAAVLHALPRPDAGGGGSEDDLEPARGQLAGIVGRDVAGLDRAEILRACAETASENAVDGLFAPLFWMLAGALLAATFPDRPGPLALAWAFKAASTLDSMLGYRRGSLRWLGTAGARLDDVLTWLPCRLVALGLPLVAGAKGSCWRLFREALREGAPDPSPNAGVSQAAYALVAGVRLGGVNRYGGQERSKPLLAAASPMADEAGVERMLALSRRLQLAWLALALPLLLLVPQLAGGGGQ
jgi:adenosylcobinamide-phosphate synthase